MKSGCEFVLQVYPKWVALMDGVEEKFSFLPRSQRAQLLGFFNSRFEEVCEYEACLAACALDPEYWMDPIIRRAEVIEALNKVALRLLGPDDFVPFMQQLARYKNRETGMSWDEFIR